MDSVSVKLRRSIQAEEEQKKEAKNKYLAKPYTKQRQLMKITCLQFLAVTVIVNKHLRIRQGSRNCKRSSTTLNFDKNIF